MLNITSLLQEVMTATSAEQELLAHQLARIQVEMALLDALRDAVQRLLDHAEPPPLTTRVTTTVGPERPTSTR